MAIQIQLRRGTTTEHNSFTGAVGELTYDTEKKQLRVHDGSTVGGKVVNDPTPQATETALGVVKIATTAIAQAGVNDTDFVTPLKLHQKINNVSFGINQRLSNPTTLANTWYTNTSGKVMFAHKEQGGVNHRVDITVRVGSTEYIFGSGTVGNNFTASVSVMAIIPIGAEYKCNYTNMIIFS